MFKHISKLLLLIILIAINIFSQDVPKSVGPAPMQIHKLAQTMTDEGQAVGDRYWIYLSSSPTFQLQRGVLESCSPMTNIGVPFTVTFPGALVNKGGVLWMNNQSSPFQLYTIDTITGVHTLVVNATGVPQANFTGMTWDGTTMYGISTTLALSQIFSINTVTGVCTPIGAATAICAGAISISGMPTTSSLFAVDIIADNLYRFNKITGNVVLVGPLGGNANFGQDAQFDWKDGALYWAAYTTGPELRKIDTTLGSGGVLCTYPAQVTGICVALPPLSPPICEQFTSVTFPPVGWTYVPGGTAYWLRNAVSGFGLGSGSAQWDCWNGPNGTRQTMATMQCAPAPSNCGIYIDLAYQPFGTAPDSLIIAASTDNGSTYVSTARLGPAQLATTQGNPSPFVPTATQWKKLYFPIPTGTNKMIFQGYSGFGDNVYIDSLCIGFIVGVGNNNNNVPKVYSLNQNYPNPFNPTTVISFGLPKAGNVKLVIYDILGREVKTLVNEFKQAGNYDINFDGSELASGIYFYTLTANEFTSTRKMLMIK